MLGCRTSHQPLGRGRRNHEILVLDKKGGRLQRGTSPRSFVLRRPQQLDSQIFALRIKKLSTAPRDFQACGGVKILASGYPFESSGLARG